MLDPVKEKKQERKLAAHLVGQQLKRAQGQRAYWQLIKEDSDRYIGELDRRIAELQTRRVQAIHEKEIAPTKFLVASADCRRLGGILHEDPRVDRNIHRLLRLKMKLADFDKDLMKLRLTPDQLALIRKAVSS